MDGCDATIPVWLCWTGAQMQIGVAVIMTVVFGLGVRGIIRSHFDRLASGPKRRGSDPGPGDMLVFAKESPVLGLGNGNEDAARPYRVIRDPQTYAKAFVPSKTGKK
ncbi:hypothetical protein ACOI1H_15745 [Loktanella sp. DJP18]|uniref:hypothetical protein n=1 Tax=Loktanella sp. DJP18 TaxID=3409788 RepID=UPI003BB7A03C